MFVAGGSIGSLSYGNSKKYSRQDTRLFHPCGFRGARHGGGEEDSTHSWKTIPQHRQYTHQHGIKRNSIQHKWDPGEIQLQAESRAMLDNKGKSNATLCYLF